MRAVVGGPTQAVGYLAFDRSGGVGAIIDAPLGSTKRFVQMIKANELTILYLINTHGHWDQIADNVAIIEATGSTLCAHSWDAARLSDPALTMEEGMKLPIVPSRASRSLHDGELLQIGEVRLQVMHTPGHSPGSICLYEEVMGALFSGDTLQRLRVGRTDMPGGSLENLNKHLARLGGLPDSTLVYPAHGLPTSIRAERWLLDLATTQVDQ